MAMLVDLDFGDVAPEAFFDATQEVLGALSEVQLTLASATVVRGLAGAGASQSTLGIDGQLRWRTTNVDRTVTGTAGVYDVWAVTGAPAVPLEATDFSWDLRVVKQGDPAPTEAFKRKIGWLNWSGTAVTRLVQVVGRRDDAPLVPTPPLAGITPLAVVGLAGQTAALITADVNGALMMSLTAAGQLALPVQGVAGGLLIGDDAQLYRSGANALTTPGALAVGGVLSAPSPAFTGTPTGPTAAVDTNTTQLASTAFVVGQASAVNPLMNGPVAVGTSLRYSRQDHVHPIDASRAPLASPAFTGAPTVGGQLVVVGNDARLSDQRVPTDGSVTDAKVAAANKDGLIAVPSLRTLGIGAQQAAAGNHQHAGAGGAFSLALGPSAAASGTYGVAIGPSAAASGGTSVAIGLNAISSVSSSVAIGNSAQASHASSVALGNSALTTAADQIRLGQGSHTVSIPGHLVVDGTPTLPGVPKVSGSASAAEVLMYGVVGTTGVLSSGSPNWTSARTGVGVYRITTNLNLSPRMIVVSPVSTSAAFATVSNVSVNTFDVRIWDAAGAALDAVGFNFTIIGID